MWSFIKYLNFILLFTFQVLGLSIYGQNTDIPLHKQKFIDYNNLDEHHTPQPYSNLHFGINYTDATIIRYFTKKYNDSIFAIQGIHPSSLVSQLNFPEIESPETPKLTSNSFNSNLQIDAIYNTLKLPYLRSPASFLRIRANPNISLFGLPFSTNLYYTTETNQLYNSNSVSINFDAYKFNKQIEYLSDQKQGNFKDLKQTFIRNQKLIENYKHDLERLKQLKEVELQKLSSNIANKTDQILQLGLDSFPLNTFDSIAYKRTALMDTTVNIGIDELSCDSVSKFDSINHFLDSIEAHKNQLSKQLEDLNKLLTYADSLQKINEALNDKIETFSKPTVKDSSEQRKIISESKIYTFLSGIREFNIGICSPYYSRNTLDGIGIKGIHLTQTIDNSSLFYSLTVGRTQVYDNGFTDSSMKFTRNILATKFGYGSIFKDYIAFIFMNSWDSKPQNNRQKMNTVSGIEFSKYHKKLTLYGEFLLSNIRTSQVYIIENSPAINQNPINLDYSLELQSDFQIAPNVYLEGQVDFKSPQFNSLGAPFLRNDYIETVVGFKSKLLKRKIRIKMHYKNLKQGISNITENPNILSGINLNLTTHFKGKPNFSLSYLPYEQSNNHVDTLLRTNNKFQTLNLLAYYNYVGERIKFVWSAMYNNSVIEFQELNSLTSETSSIGLNQYSESKKLTSSLSISKMWTNKNIDSLDFTSLNADITFKLKHFNIGLLSNNKLSNSGASFVTQSLHASFSFLKVQIKLQMGIGYINNFWDYQSKWYQTGRIQLQYRI